MIHAAVFVDIGTEFRPVYEELSVLGYQLAGMAEANRIRQRRDRLLLVLGLPAHERLRVRFHKWRNHVERWHRVPRARTWTYVQEVTP